MSGRSSRSMASASPAELVDAYVAAWNTRDGNAVVASLAPGATYVDPLLPEPVSGDALAGYVSALAVAFPDFSFTWTSHEGSGEAFARWVMRGTYSGTLPGVPGPTGALFEVPGMDYFTVGPEGITTVVGITDQTTLLRQLGIEIHLSIAE